MIVDDIWIGVRRLTRKPSSSLFTILLLATAIAIGACVFSVVYGMLWKPLPYASEGSLVQLKSRSVKMGIDLGWSIPYLKAISSGTEQLSGVAAYQRKEASVSDLDGARDQQINVLMAEPGVFSLLGAQAKIGRLFAETDAKEGADPVVVVSDALWKSNLGSTKQPLDKRIRVDGKIYRVVGVLPETFVFSDRSVQAWLPLSFSEEERSIENAGSFGSMQAIARLKDSATLESATSEMVGLIRSDDALRGIADQIDLRVSVLPLRSIWLEGRERSLKSILLAAALVFGIALANVYNLFMLRLIDRRQEFALLEAVGATQANLKRQVAAEAIVLSLVSTLIAALVVPLGIATLRRYNVLPEGTPQEIGFDLQTILCVVAMFAGASAIMVSASLAFHGQKVYEVLRQTGNGQTASTRVQKLRQALVVGQIAATFVLLFGTALLVRSSQKLLEEQVGFERTRQLVADIQPQPTVELDSTTVRSQIGAWKDVLSKSAGVQAVGLSSSAPFSENVTLDAFQVSGAGEVSREELPKAYISYINADYPSAIGLRILRGRAFTSAEAEQQASVVLVDEDLAGRYFAGANPTGKTIQVTDSETGELVAVTVVGVVNRVRQRSLTDRDEYPSIYRPNSIPYAIPGIPTNSVEAIIEADQPLLLTSLAEKTLTNVSTGLELSQVTTMEARISDTISDVLRLNSLLKILSFLTIFITSVGLYALMANNVAIRGREFGIRQALGASAGDIMRGVLLQGIKLLAIAFAIALPMALLLGASLKSRLHEVTGQDPLSILLVCMLLFAVAMLANLLPALRASRVKPIDALRSD